MKVLLTHPRFEPNTNPPLGIAYIASYLRQNGIEAEILDCTFRDFAHAEERLSKGNFDFLGISCFTMNYNKGLEMARIAKEANPDVHVCFGGNHPTIMPDAVLKEQAVDSVAVGEGEQTVLETVKSLEKGKPLKGALGLAYKEKGKAFHNKPRPLIENLDTLPFPARDLLPMDDYLNAEIGRGAWAVKQPSTSIIGSRGCPYNCTYCSSYLMFGRRTRFRSAESIVREIEFLIGRYRINGLSFVDDTYALNPKKMIEFCDLLVERGIGLEWICNARVNTVNPEVLRKMKSAGCTTVSYGVESGDQWVLDNILKKGITLKQVEDAFKWTKDAGMYADALFMVGTPGETRRHIENTIRFARKINADVCNFSITRPMPKTEMYDIALKYGTITAKSWDDYSFMAKPIFSSKELPADEIKRLQRKAYFSFYFNPLYILRQITSVRGFGDAKRLLNGLQMVMRAT